MNKIKKFNENYDFDDDGLDDGVYDITDIDYLFVYYRTDIKKIEEFKKKYPNWYECTAYGVEGLYLLSEKPTKEIKIDNNYHPNFEGHGTLTVIDNCPRRIIIIGEND